jgi:hypothetical protein
MPFNTASSYAFTGISGFSGKSGYSGYSGFSGAYTFFGYTGFSGYTGYTGFSGFVSTGSSGYSGFQGAQGAPGAIVTTNISLSTTDNVIFSNVTVTSLSTTGVITASAIGTTGVMQQSGNNMIMWVPTVSAFYSERSYVGTLSSQSLQAFTLSGSWPSNARYLLADVYVNQSASSSQIFTIGRWYLSAGPTSIPGAGAYQPSSYFNYITQTSNTIRIRIPSSAVDGFWYQNGYWASCQVVPVTGGNTVYVANTQATSVSGWIAMVVKAYSL